jgi:hypothetical protein
MVIIIHACVIQISVHSYVRLEILNPGSIFHAKARQREGRLRDVTIYA